MGLLNDELKVAFESTFGMDTEQWKELPIYRTFQMIVAQGSSGFTVGMPLCKIRSY